MLVSFENIYAGIFNIDIGARILFPSHDHCLKPKKIEPSVSQILLCCGLIEVRKVHLGQEFCREPVLLESNRVIKVQIGFSH